MAQQRHQFFVLDDFIGASSAEQKRRLLTAHHDITRSGIITSGPLVELRRQIEIDDSFTLPGRTRDESLAIIESVRSRLVARAAQHVSEEREQSFSRLLKLGGLGLAAIAVWLIVMNHAQLPLLMEQLGTLFNL